MAESDPIREKWAAAYSGRTDNGLKLPITRVVPGAIILGEPIGYFLALRPGQTEDVWEWHWTRIP